MTPDVNVRVAAARSDHPHHGIARAWLEKTLGAAGSGLVCTLMPMALAGFLRLVTSPKIFERPRPIDEANAWLAAAVAKHGEHLVSFDRDFRKLLGRARFTHLASRLA